MKSGRIWQNKSGMAAAMPLSLSVSALLLSGRRLLRRRRGRERHAADVDIDLGNFEAGHGFHRSFDVLLHLLCHIADVVAEQRKEADLDPDRPFLADLDANALGNVFLLKKLTISLVRLEYSPLTPSVSEAASAAIEATTSSEIRMQPWSSSVDQYSL